MGKKVVTTVYVYDEEYGWVNVNLFISTVKAKLKTIEKQSKLNGLLRTGKRITSKDYKSGIMIYNF